MITKSLGYKKYEMLYSTLYNMLYNYEHNKKCFESTAATVFRPPKCNFKGKCTIKKSGYFWPESGQLYCATYKVKYTANYTVPPAVIT